MKDIKKGEVIVIWGEVLWEMKVVIIGSEKREGSKVKISWVKLDKREMEGIVIE